MEPFWRVREKFCGLSEDILNKLRLFHVELFIYNQKLSLLDPGKEADVDLTLFYPSLVSADFIKKDNAGESSLCVVGARSGVFGIIYAILFSDARVLLSEEDSRYAEYLRYMTKKLNLLNVEVVEGRTDGLKVADFSVFYANDIANLARTLLLAGKILKKRDKLYIMKSTDWFSELASLPSQICSTWNNEMALEMDLPENKGVRVVIRSQKTS